MYAVKRQCPTLSALSPTCCCRALNTCTRYMQPLHVRFSLFTAWDLLCQKGLLTPAGKNASVKSKEAAERKHWVDEVGTVPHSSIQQFFKPKCTVLLKAN